MKTKTAFLRAPLLAAAIACSAALLPAQDAYRELGATPPLAAEASPAKKASYSSQPGKNTTTARISFSDRSKPGTLKINMTVAEIGIEGTSGNEIIVTSSLDQKGAPKTDDDGFRRLDQEQAFELVEKDNVATLRIAGGSPRSAAGAEFKIKVPRNTNLSIRTQSVEGVEIDDIDGDIEVNSTNGEISLENVSGSVVANTMSGKIDAEFKRAPQKPVSLTSMSGAIELSLPPKSAANLRMRTLSGAIRTNFPESALKTTTETRADAKARKVSMQVTHDGDSGVTVVTSNSGDSYAFSTTTGEVQIPRPRPRPPRRVMASSSKPLSKRARRRHLITPTKGSPPPKKASPPQFRRSMESRASATRKKNSSSARSKPVETPCRARFA
ncbi:DUF4097 family beta strand repeat-containing protein [Ereboglobus luteus]|nr:DUF4097 family beta strand repeat-containing protein [Ereboglobus luteus]